MKLTVIAVGKVKESYLRAGISEYGKRLGRYCQLTVIEVPDEKAPDGASEAQERQIKKTEGERILARIRDGDYVTALAIEGEELDSVQLSRRIERLGVQGRGSLTFVIGGSLGLSDEVLARADWKLSFSRMTFPHQLMRVILLEQLYRSFRIMRREPYHK